MIGSHNSLSYLPIKGWRKILKPWVKCQSKTIEEQYNSGEYKDIWSQINSLHFDDIVIGIERYPMTVRQRYHINIWSKDGYGMCTFITSSDIDTHLPIPEDELQRHINVAKRHFNEVRSHNYKLIDLGLPSGTLWMDRNIGAKSPTDFGLYFAWGETKGYTADEISKTKQFEWIDYKYANSAYDSFTKYCNNSNYGNDGYTDSLVTLQTTDDAAYQFTNGKCQMPTKAQIQELIDTTTFGWTTQGGVKGKLFTSKTNGNSIFVPAAGDCSNIYVNGVGKYGYLWSGSLYESSTDKAWKLLFDSEAVGYYFDDRCYGFPVRGVVSNNK